MKRIGIMGGTFDPIHLGHLLMAEQAFEQYELDQVMFLPTGDPPHKEGRKIAPADIRRKMVEMAIFGNPHFFCSSMEIEREGYSYTAKTLTELRKAHPDTSYYFIVGADSLDYMERWYHPREIFQQAVILAASRNSVSEEEVQFKIKQLKERYQADIRPVRMPLIEISSTEIRSRLSDGKSIRYFVPDQVAEYLASSDVYRT